MRRQVVDDARGLGPGRGHRSRCSWPWGTRAGRCGRRRPAHLERFPPEALLPALEAALRDGENAGARNAAMEIYVRLRRGRGARAPPAPPDDDEEVRNFAAVMLGPLKDRRSVVPLIDGPAGPRRERAPRRRRQPSARSAIPRRCFPSWTPCAPSPGSQYPAIHALGEIADPRAAPALLDLLGDEFFRGPALEALGRLADRERPSPPGPPPARSRAGAAQRGHPGGGGDRAAGHRRGGEPRPRGAGRPAPRGPRGPPAADAGGRRFPEPAYGRHHPGLAAGGRARCAPWWSCSARPACRSTRATPSCPSASWTPPAYERGPRPPRRRRAPGAVRCLSWIAPARRHRSRGSPHPRPRRRGARRGGGRHRASGRRGRGHAAVRAAGRRERADPGERHGRAPRLPRERVVPLLVQALARPRRPGAGAGGRGPGAAARTRRPRPPWWARPAIRARACGAPRCRPWARSRRPRCSGVLRAGLPDESSLVRQQAVLSLGKPAGRRGGARPAAPARGSGSADALRGRARPRPDPQPGRGAAPAALPRRRAQGAALRRRGGPGRHAGSGGGAGPDRGAARPRPQPAPGRGRRAWADRRSPGGAARCCSPSRTSTGACAARRRPPSAASAARRPCPRCSLRLADEDATVRRAAVAALGELRRPARRGRLLRALADPGLQATAAEALRRLGAVGARPSWSGPSPAPPPRCAGCSWTSPADWRTGRARRLLLAALADDSASVRAEAALALGDGELPRGAARAHGPEGQGPLAGGAPGRRPGPQEAGAPR